MRLDITVTSDKTLTDLADRLDDATPGLKAVANAMRSREADTFTTADGGQWDPLDPSTVENKGNNRILVDRGALERSLTIPGAPDAIERVSSDAVFVGSKDVAGIMNARGVGGRPVRNAAPPLSTAELAKLGEAFADWLFDD